MNDGLLALKRLKGEGRVGVYDEIDVDQDFDRAEYYLQAIDIVKEKKVDMDFLFEEWEEENYEFALENYNANHDIELTLEQYGHLIEVFDND